MTSPDYYLITYVPDGKFMDGTYTQERNIPTTLMGAIDFIAECERDELDQVLLVRVGEPVQDVTDQVLDGFVTLKAGHTYDETMQVAKSYAGQQATALENHAAKQPTSHDTQQATRADSWRDERQEEVA